MEKWFTLLVKTKLRFLGVEDAYFHTVCFNSSALRASMVVKLVLQRYAYCTWCILCALQSTWSIYGMWAIIKSMGPSSVTLPDVYGLVKVTYQHTVSSKFAQIN